jgi:phenylpropionate dioxygenase-like ring-hydroxylating dioxygenase large terminal subunit
MSLLDHWYVLCRSEDLRGAPLATELWSQPIALFRGPGRAPCALLDRCPHRNVPLSLGTVRDATLECRYHGWRFDQRGACVRVPGRCEPSLPSGTVPRFATREQDGYVWAWGRPDAEPSAEPFRVAALERDHTVLHATADYPGDLQASLENTIDVPHTAFLHRGLFRSTAPKQPISCTVRRAGREVHASYEGEVRPDTWFARLLAPGGGTLTHVDRFIAPSIVSVEYRLGPKAHLASTALFSPLSAQRTRLHVQVAFRLAGPSGWLSPLLERVMARVLREDTDILAAQSHNLARFSGPHFASTELDTFSGQIRRLLAQAELGAIDDEQSQQQYAFMI